jgi:hypothetical protein
VPRFMKRILTKCRGILGLAMIAGGAGLMIGALWTLAALRLRYGFFPDLTNWFFLTGDFFPKVLEWGIRSAMSGAAFGGVLAVVEPRTVLSQLPAWRVGFYGGVVGLSLVEGTLLLRALTGPLVFSEAVLATLPAAGIFGVLGALLATSTVAIAKRVERGEIEASSQGGVELLAVGQ